MSIKKALATILLCFAALFLAAALFELASPGAAAQYLNRFKLTDGVDTADVTTASALKVDGSAATQPVSGTVAVSAVSSLTPGTNTSQLGKAEDGAATSGETGVSILAVRRDAAVALTDATGEFVQPAADNYGALFTRNDHPNRFQCSLDAIAATLTQCQAAPAAGLSLYVTNVVAGSTTSTAGQHLLRYGTGTNCGTGTTTLFPGTGTTARVPSPANTVAPAMVQFNTPVKVPAANALCVIGVATNTTWIVITGYIAP
jgi:hypothetical protein